VSFTESFLMLLVIMIVALTIDLTLGEPLWQSKIPLHPTVLINRFVGKILPAFKSKNPKKEKAKGLILALTTVSLTTVTTYFLLYLTRLTNVILYILLASVMFKVTFCIKLETDMAKEAARCIKDKDLERGRELTAYFSRRETQNLNERQIASAIIESIAENLTDFKLSPIFYYSIFGVPGAMAFKTINVLDGTVGFKDAEHIHVGWASAMMDTLANFFLSRLTAILIVLAALISRGSPLNAWKILLRDRRKVPSINHGWPMAAMAGALNIQLEKPGVYVIGDENEVISHEHIYMALKIRNIAIFLFLLLIAVPLMFLNTHFLGFQI